jgi:hypothetical protein
MATQDTSTETNADEIITEEVNSVIAESTTEPEEDREPEEGDYTDPAEFRKALKEFAHAQGVKASQVEHKRQMDGVLSDLRKQRKGKRELVERMENFESKFNEFANRANPMEKPDPARFQSPEDYAKAWSAWNANEEKKAPQVDTVKAEFESIMPTWEARANHATMNDPDFVEACKRAGAEKTGEHIAEVAVLAFMKSPVGVEIYKYLANNPDVTESIEDLPKDAQVRAIKVIESNIMSARFERGSQDRSTAQQPVAPLAKPSRVATPPKAGTGAVVTAPKKLEDAKSMKEYMELRNRK